MSANKSRLHSSTSQPTGVVTFDPSSFSAVKPPVSNTGAEITAPLSNRVLFDFLSFTFPKENDPSTVLSIVGLDPDSFSPCSHGSMGYKKSLRIGNISVLFDGSDGMGVHVSMTGQGCREYEARFTTADPWLSLFENVLIQKGQFTRLDIAIDNIDGQLDLDKLEAQINEKNIRSRFKKGRKISEFSLSAEDSNLGKTLYVGSAQSRLQIRFYDKAAQLGCTQHWTRAEIQLRSERAQVAAEMYHSSLEPSQIATGIINNYFSVINHDDSNKSRCSLQQWWSNWLASTEKLPLTVAKVQKTALQVADYIVKQYAPSIAMLKEYFQHDFHDFIRSMVRDGKERMSIKHYQILHASA